MHQHNVAHLDLKPDNLVLTEGSDSPRLLIIDFSVFLHVDGPEAWFHDYRGTEGWVAPEMQNEKYQPIRADLFSAGLVLQWIAKRQAVTDNQLTGLKNRLLNKNPGERPLLTSIEIQNQWQGKRKLEHYLEGEEEAGWHTPRSVDGRRRRA